MTTTPRWTHWRVHIPGDRAVEATRRVDTGEVTLRLPDRDEVKIPLEVAQAVSAVLAGATGSAPNAPAVELWRDTDVGWRPVHFNTAWE